MPSRTVVGQRSDRLGRVSHTALSPVMSELNPAHGVLRAIHLILQKTFASAE